MYVIFCFMVCFFKKKTAYEMRISDWSSDVCSSDLQPKPAPDDIGESVDVRLLHKRQIEVGIIGEKAHGHTVDIPEVPQPALQIAIGEHMRRAMAKHRRWTHTPESRSGFPRIADQTRAVGGGAVLCWRGRGVGVENPIGG